MLSEEEVLYRIIASNNVQLLFRVAEEIMGTQGLIDCSLPFWSEEDRNQIIWQTYKLMKR